MTRAEAIAAVVGFACLVAAFVGVDWRLGLGVLGCGLLISAIDLPRRTT